MPLFRKPPATPNHERTAEERERERLERERRRLERSGHAFDPALVSGAHTQEAQEPPPDELAALDGHAEPAPPPEPPAALPPAAVPPSTAVHEPAPPADPAPPPEREPEPESEPLGAAQDGDETGETPVISSSRPRSRRGLGIEPPPLPGERPHRRLSLPSRERLTAGARDSALRERLLERRARRLREQREPLLGGSHSRRARVFAGLAVLAAIFAIWFLASLFQPFKGSGHGSVAIDIPKGANAGKVGSILSQHGVVSSGFFFNIRATIAGKRGDLRPGHYVLKKDMSYGAALDALTKAPPPVHVMRVVVSEGKSRRQIAALARADGLVGSYLKASASSRVLIPSHYGASRSITSLEGFLYPATYEMRAGSTAQQLVDQQIAAFRRNFGRPFVQTAHRRHISPYQALTVASMVEREAAVAKDRPLIAAVIYNRLRLRMPLGIDATIRYALGDKVAPLTGADLAINSPYNTRTHRGLPPTPIGNPGAASIQAALVPARVPYLYYVVKPCGNGAHVFSTTYRQFLADSARYNGARAQKGGRSPASC